MAKFASVFVLKVPLTNSLPGVQLRHYNKLFASQKARSVYHRVELYPLRFALKENRGYVPTLSPGQVTSILYMNEATVEGRVKGLFPVKGFDSNQLGSNNPVEDRRAVARILHDNASIFGVFDGHGGTACAQAVSERLFDYIAVSLLPQDKLEEYSHSLKTDSPINLLQWYIFNNDYVNRDLSTLYKTSLQKFVTETLSTHGYDDTIPKVSDALRTGCLQLDYDISAEAQPMHGVINYDSVMTALSGCCGSVAHVSGKEVFVGNVGDTRAVIGQRNSEGQWVAKTLTSDHNAENEAEVARLKSSHPLSEHRSLLQNSRLLGDLIPLRAFGDIRYKWQLKSLTELQSHVGTNYAYHIVPKNYYTPPYLIAEPEVFHHKLSSSDRFMVMASDGLWDCLSNQEVVQIVGDHMEGKSTRDKFDLVDHSMSLSEINNILEQRKRGLAHKPIDSNAATHLIRHALGPEHRKLSEMLTFGPDVVRHYRDDITIIVVFFDEKFLKKEEKKK